MRSPRGQFGGIFDGKKPIRIIDRAPVRLPNVILDRLNDAAQRHGLDAAEIARRSVRKYISAIESGVVTLPNRIVTTRTNSRVVKFSGINNYSYLEQLGQIITWYLNNEDNGSSAHISQAEIDELARANGPYIVDNEAAQ